MSKPDAMNARPAVPKGARSVAEGEGEGEGEGPPVSAAPPHEALAPTAKPKDHP
jgi:hypothetical protein